MDTARILTELRSEKDRIQKAIDALEALNSPSTTQRVQQTASQAARKPRGHRISAAARKRMAEGQRKRWDKKKADTPDSSKTVTSKKAAKKGGLTPAGRRRLSANMKKRWADKKKAAKTA